MFIASPNHSSNTSIFSKFKRILIENYSKVAEDCTMHCIEYWNIRKWFRHMPTINNIVEVFEWAHKHTRVCLFFDTNCICISKYRELEHLLYFSFRITNSMACIASSQCQNFNRSKCSIAEMLIVLISIWWSCVFIIIAMMSSLGEWERARERKLVCNIESERIWNTFLPIK